MDGKEIEVALEKKLEMMRHGFDQYMMEDGKIVLKPVPKIKSKFKKLVDVDKGYHFIDDDIHWPEKIDKGGKAWRIEYE